MSFAADENCNEMGKLLLLFAIQPISFSLWLSTTLLCVDRKKAWFLAEMANEIWLAETLCGCISCLCGWRRSSKWQINVNILRSAVHMCATTDPIPINVEYINRQCRKRDRKTDNNMFCGNNHRCWLAACIGMSMVGAVASTIGLLRLCDCYATSHSRNESKWNGMDNFKY